MRPPVYAGAGLLKKYKGRHFSIHAKENVPTMDGVLGVPWADLVPAIKVEYVPSDVSDPVNIGVKSNSVGFRLFAL